MVGGQVATGAFGAPIFMRSDSELHTPDGPSEPSSQFIYSAPAIPNGQQSLTPVTNMEAKKESTAPPEAKASSTVQNPPERKRNNSLLSNGSSSNPPPRRKKSSVGEEYGRNRSEMEIRNQHYKIQSQYRKQNQGQPKRQRRLTDIDFEGILQIIGLRRAAKKLVATPTCGAKR
ncbi:hypothetical protein L596_006512 [Steinernema carpocapsae]|uniref:Uncharacterized protein n=1 Tax=Steinernema carpocapsae TaxID=34508 RepID=A0A4U8V4R2_STECR|nr:hypothetical protein L596_006512 [Steinernema carpocapsae]